MVVDVALLGVGSDFYGIAFHTHPRTRKTLFGSV